MEGAEIIFIGKSLLSKAAPMSRAIQYMEHGLRKYGEAEIYVPDRVIHKYASVDKYSLISAAYIREGDFGIKAGTIVPENVKCGHHLVHAIYLLFSGATGRLRALINGAELTNIRTGAICGVATKYLSRADARILAVIGSGVQAAYQIKAVCEVRDIKEIRIYSRNRESAKKFVDGIRNEFLGEVVLCSSSKEAVKEADIISTVTSNNTHVPVVDLADIKPDVHINAVGGRTLASIELDPVIFAYGKVVVDSVVAALNESAEIRCSIERGYISKEDLCELRDIMSMGYTSEGVSIFRTVGIAISDYIIASKVADFLEVNNN